MEKIWFTSDNHFGHKSILRFCPETRMRCADTDEMNEKMIEIWNNIVALEDRVYTLGDFSFMNTQKTEEVLKRLNGRKFLIKGNHDNWVNSHLTSYFEAVYDYKKISIDGKRVVLFHYPIWEWENMHHGSYHLFGHVHGNTTVPGRAMDVGIDARPQKDMGLWSWEEIDAILSKREIRTHHGKTIEG
jgi:calcineurin-like phosphoesterase family protein